MPATVPAAASNVCSLIHLGTSPPPNPSLALPLPHSTRCVILSFGFRVYEQRALVKRHFVEIMGTMVASTFFSLVVTLLFANALVRAVLRLCSSLRSPVGASLGSPQPTAAVQARCSGVRLPRASPVQLACRRRDVAPSTPSVESAEFQHHHVKLN